MTLFIAQVFERTGKSKDQDETPVVIDGELRTLKKRHRQEVTHVHTHTYIQSYFIFVCTLFVYGNLGHLCRFLYIFM